MLRPADNYFEKQDEPAKSCLLALRKMVLSTDTQITEEWKYNMPFYCYNGKMMCYLWIHKKYKKPYLGIVPGSILSGDDLLQEKRARMKIFLISPDRDIPVKRVKTILKQLVTFYRQYNA